MHAPPPLSPQVDAVPAKGIDVALCVCTWRRPDGLRRLLKAVDRLKCGRDLRLALVVVDNDTERAGLAVCREMADTLRWPPHTSFEPRSGISYARNRAVAQALELRPRLIAMLDDDEWPSRGWLGELMRNVECGAADAAGGPVLPQFPSQAALWKGLSRYYTVDLGLADGSPCTLYAAGNFIARAECFAALMPEPFDPAFAETGGEDLVFFRRLSKLGYRMRWATHARVYEAVSKERLSLEWLRRRQRRTGRLNVCVQRMFAPGWAAETVRLGKTAALLILALAYGAAAWPSPLARARASLLLHKALGKIEGHRGVRVAQYGDSGAAFVSMERAATR